MCVYNGLLRKLWPILKPITQKLASAYKANIFYRNRIFEQTAVGKTTEFFSFACSFTAKFQNVLPLHFTLNCKDAVKSVLRIGSAHNKGGPTDVNIAQILHLLNFFWIETLVYIHLRAYQTRTVLYIQLVYHILQI
jgi:hypothetical protein